MLKKVEFKKETPDIDKKHIYRELITKNIKGDVEVRPRPEKPIGGEGETDEELEGDGGGEWKDFDNGYQYRERKPKERPNLDIQPIQRPPEVPPVKKIGRLEYTDVELNRTIDRANLKNNNDYEYFVSNYDNWTLKRDKPDNASGHILLDKDLYLKPIRKKR
jgi:hypothetical protein